MYVPRGPVPRLQQATQAHQYSRREVWLSRYQLRKTCVRNPSEPDDDNDPSVLHRRRRDVRGRRPLRPQRAEDLARRPRVERGRGGRRPLLPPKQRHLTAFPQEGQEGGPGGGERGRGLRSRDRYCLIAGLRTEGGSSARRRSSGRSRSLVGPGSLWSKADSPCRRKGREEWREGEREGGRRHVRSSAARQKKRRMACEVGGGGGGGEDTRVILQLCLTRRPSVPE